MIVALAQSPADAKLQAQLKQLFPAATSFSPKEGEPPHFKAFIKDAGASQTGAGGPRFLDHGAAAARTRLRRPDQDARRHGHERRPHWRHCGRAQGAVRGFLGRTAGVRRAVQEQEHPRSVQGRRRHRRRVDRDDNHDERDARHQKRRTAVGQTAPHARGSRSDSRRRPPRRARAPVVGVARAARLRAAARRSVRACRNDTR